MLISFTDAISLTSVFVNPKNIVAVFVAHEGDHIGKTVINLSNGNLIVTIDQLEAVGLINGALRND